MSSPSSFSFSLSTRYRIRPAVLSDSVGIAHLLCHTLWSDCDIAQSIGMESWHRFDQSHRIIQFLLTQESQFSFVCVDTQFESHRNEFIEALKCDCFEKSTESGHPIKSELPDYQREKELIVAAAICHDIQTKWPHLLPNERWKTVPNETAGSTRLAIEELHLQPLLTSPLPPNVESCHPQPLSNSSSSSSKLPTAEFASSPSSCPSGGCVCSNDPLHHDQSALTSYLELNPKIAPYRIIELLFLLTYRSYSGLSLAYHLSEHLLFNFHLHHPQYKYLHTDAVSPATTHIFTQKIRGQIMNELDMKQWKFKMKSGEERAVFERCEPFRMIRVNIAKACRLLEQQNKQAVADSTLLPSSSSSSAASLAAKSTEFSSPPPNCRQAPVCPCYSFQVSSSSGVATSSPSVPPPSLASRHCLTNRPVGLHSRYIIRPMVSSDISSVAHLIAHTWYQDTDLAACIRTNAAARVDMWVPLLAYLLENDCSFVCVDTQFGANRELVLKHFSSCNCASAGVKTPLENLQTVTELIVSVAIMHDLVFDWHTRIPPDTPATDERNYAISAALHETRKQPILAPLRDPTSSIPCPHSQCQLMCVCGADPLTHWQADLLSYQQSHPSITSYRVCDLLWLCTLLPYQCFGLGKHISFIAFSYIYYHRLEFKYLQIDATSLGTASIWTKHIPGQIMQRLNVSDFEFELPSTKVKEKTFAGLAPFQLIRVNVERAGMKMGMDKLATFQRKTGEPERE